MMSKALLLNMATYKIVHEFATMAEADERQDDEEFKGFPKHLVNRDDWDLPAADMVKFFNNLPNVKVPVKRFSDRATAMKRLLAALNGEVQPEPTTTDEPETTKGKPTMATKKSTKKTKTPKAPKGERKARAPAHAPDAVLKPTKAGTERRWHTESPRAQLFAYIVKKESITYAEFLKYATGPVGLTTASANAALGKLLDTKHAAGGASVKMNGG